MTILLLLFPKFPKFPKFPTLPKFPKLFNGLSDFVGVGVVVAPPQKKSNKKPDLV